MLIYNKIKQPPSIEGGCDLPLPMVNRNPKKNLIKI